MFVQLSTPLPCETMKDQTNSCNRPSHVGVLSVVETFSFAGYTMRPICSHCIGALATAAGQPPVPPSEAIEAATIKRVLSAQLGVEGAEEALSAIRAAVSEDADDAED